VRARIQRFANSFIYDDAFIVEEGAELSLLVHRTRSIKSSLSVSVYLSRRRPLSASHRETRQHNNNTLEFFFGNHQLFFCLGFCSFSSSGGEKRLLTTRRIEKRALLLEQQLANKRRKPIERETDQKDRATETNYKQFSVCVCVCVCV
jgi:hypothetical protein